MAKPVYNLEQYLEQEKGCFGADLEQEDLYFGAGLELKNCMFRGGSGLLYLGAAQGAGIVLFWSRFAGSNIIVD